MNVLTGKSRISTIAMMENTQHHIRIVKIKTDIIPHITPEYDFIEDMNFLKGTIQTLTYAPAVNDWMTKGWIITSDMIEEEYFEETHPNTFYKGLK